MTKLIKQEQIKEIELKILKELVEICDEQSIRYRICGGTLLGAIRHKGFIPWDDDIDIMMPRKDYEKFIEYCNSHKTEFKLICHQNTDECYRLFAKFYDDKTEVEECENALNICKNGVWVDVFPLDGLGDSLQQAEKILKKTKLKRQLLDMSVWKSFKLYRKYTTTTKKGFVYTLGRYILYLISRFTNKQRLIKKIEAQYKNIDFDSSVYCGAVCGAYGAKEIVERAYFDEFIEVEFEKMKLKAPIGYDKYLTSIYVDYMVLPPPDKRVSHPIDAYYKEND